MPLGLGDDAGSAGIVRTKHVTFDEPGQALELEGGGTLWPLTIAYETYGTLSEARDNAILVCHALSGDAHVAGRHSANDRKVGWWDMMIGPGKGLDTDRYFVISANVIGGCGGSTGPSSEDPATGRRVRHALPHHHHRRHGERPGHAARPPRDPQAPGGRRRVDGRHAGAPVDGRAPRPAPPRDPTRHRGSAAHAGHRLQRGRPPGDHGRPGLARRRLLRRQAAGQGARRRTHGRPHHLPLRRGDEREVRPPPARHPRLLVHLLGGLRGRELPAPPGALVHRAASTPTAISTSRARSTTSTSPATAAASSRPSAT